MQKWPFSSEVTSDLTFSSDLTSEVTFSSEVSRSIVISDNTPTDFNIVTDVVAYFYT